MVATIRLMTKGLLLIALVVAFTRPVRAQEPDDVRITALRDAGLLTVLNASQTVDDFTFTLEWVYADPHQIMLSYAITHPEIDFAADDAPASYLPYGSLADPDGNLLAYASQWGEPVQWADGQSALRYIQTFNPREASHPTPDGEYPYEYMPDYFETRYGAEPPDELSLQFYGEIKRLEPGEIPLPPMAPTEDVTAASYPFEFTVPLQTIRRLTPAITQTAGDLDMTLESVTLTPALAFARLCYDLPDGRDWHPHVTDLEINGIPALLQGWGMDRLPSPDDTSRCTEVEYWVAYTEQPGSLTLTVNKLTTSEPGTREYWDAVAEGLAEYDIVIDVVLGGGRFFDLVSKPDAMTDEEYTSILFEVRGGLLPAVEGPWIFEVALP